MIVSLVEIEPRLPVAIIGLTYADIENSGGCPPPIDFVEICMALGMRPPIGVQIIVGEDHDEIFATLQVAFPDRDFGLVANEGDDISTLQKNAARLRLEATINADPARLN